MLKGRLCYMYLAWVVVTALACLAVEDWKGAIHLPLAFLFGRAFALGIRENPNDAQVRPR